MKIEHIDFNEFPTTRFQGSKRKIVNWIYENVKDLDFYTVLDGCGGTGSVSYLFKSMGKKVDYNDKLYFNYLIGKSIIENNDVILTKDDINEILSFDNLNEKSFIHNNFKNIYYIDEENEWLDNILASINKFNLHNNNTRNYKVTIALNALIQAALTKRPFNLFHRKNLHLRTNDVERNFGNKITWEKSFEAQFKLFTDEINKAIINTGTECYSYNYSILDFPESNYDLVYLDPPYINKAKNETNDYLKIYHFLEGMVNYDDWPSYIDRNTKNLRFKREYYEQDFNPTSIYKTLEKLIKKFSGSQIVLSYKKGGVPSIEDIISLMKNYKKTVYCTSMHYKYALNKQNGNAKLNREVLIFGL